jgi:hypothetical protein
MSASALQPQAVVFLVECNSDSPRRYPDEEAFPAEAVLQFIRKFDLVLF